MAKIMVVDDTKVMRLHLTKIFTELGHEVVASAEDGEEALEDYLRHSPEIVTLDLNMPGIGGVETLKKLRQLNPAVKVIVVTSRQDEETVKECIQAGARHYLIKPINKDDVVRKLGEILK